MSQNPLHLDASHYAQTLESLCEGVWVWDIHHDTCLCNRWLYHMLGHTAQTLELNKLFDLQKIMHSEDWGLFLATLQALLDQRIPMLATKVRLLTKSSLFKHALIRGTIARRDGEGRPLQLNCTVSDLDVLENYQHQLQLLSAMEQRQEDGRYGHGNHLDTEADSRLLTSTISFDLHNSQDKLAATLADISALTSNLDGISYVDTMLNDLQRLAKVGCAVANYDTGQVRWTLGLYLILDTDPSRFTPTMQSIQQFMTVSSRNALLEAFRNSANQPTRHECTVELITQSGRTIWVHSIAMMTWKNGRVHTRTEVLQDITEQVKLESSLRESETVWKRALDGAGDGMWDWNIPEKKLYYSNRLLEHMGYSPDDFDNSMENWETKLHPDDKKKRQRKLNSLLDGTTDQYRNEFRYLNKSGDWRWVQTSASIISRDQWGAPVRVVGIHTDITERKKTEASMQHQALYDALTGLPNRRMLRDRLTQEMRYSQRSGKPLALLFIDLDHFKEVNDTLGHDQGDVLLIEAAQRISCCLRSTDTVARMGGDEFTVILPDIEHGEYLEGILNKIVNQLSQGFSLNNEVRYVSASVGITFYPQDGEDIETLFKNADQALYAAKDAGRSRYHFFTQALQLEAQRRAVIARDLRSALHQQEFCLMFQPIIDCQTLQVTKAESLLRWKHPTKGWISPVEFIPVAESTDLIGDLGDWVFEQTCKTAKEWRQTLSPTIGISLNKSPKQFKREPAEHIWTTRLRDYGLPGDAIVIEITESLLLDKDDAVTNQLLALGDAGFQIALDDFGTGYSSLAYLQRFEIDYIKIDQTFVRHLIAQSTDLALCKAMIAMAHTLDIQVVAEGVETKEQFELLRDVGCDYAQGFYFAKPMEKADFERFYLETEKARQGDSPAELVKTVAY